ncbi:MAG: hypothetical protein JO316_07980 [Abitibacteriaceae bacterium]|nr:hypothetical protein [Abditibacteriaceae bacterium]
MLNPLIGLSGAQAAPVPPLRFDPTPMPLTMRDATGRVWGHYGYSGQQGVFYQVGNSWQHESFPATDGAETISMQKRPNGKVVCFWNGKNLAVGEKIPRIGKAATKPALSDSDSTNGEQQDMGYVLSEHCGTTSRLLCSFRAQPYSVSFSVDNNNAWIIIENKEIYRVTEAGTIEHTYSITPDQEQRLGNAALYKEVYNNLSTIVDGQGHTWFWSNFWSEGANAYLLRGFLIWDGQKMARYATLPGWSAKGPFAVDTIAPKDATHVWMGVDEHGLYSVDCVTLQAQPVREPAPKAFKYLQYITPRGGNWYVVAGARWGNEATDAAINTGQLWRLHSGKWQLLIDGLDADTSWGWHLTRPLLETRAGLWVAGSGVGLWFISHDQLERASVTPTAGRQALKVVPIDWRRGFVLQSVEELDSEPDGSIVAVDYPGRETITNLQALLSLQPSPRVRAFQTVVGITQDKQRHLWAMLSLRARALNEWNGEQWLSHALPKTYKAESPSELALDKLGRVWLLPDSNLGQTAIFDPAKPAPVAWQIFASYNQALLAQRREVNGHYVVLAPPQFARVRSEFRIHPFMAPDYSRDGRICYRSYIKQVRYYDGKVWHKWSAQQIYPTSKDHVIDMPAPPFFDHSGALCVHLDGDTWQWHEGSGWQKHAYESDPRPEAKVPDPTSVEVPRELIKQINNESSKRIGDKTGTVWLLWRKQLYKIRGNLYAPQFAAGENHPFLTANYLPQVFVDGRGNRFFKTGDDPYNYAMLLHSMPPATRVQVKANAVDSFTLSFSSPTLGAKWFKWRLDKGQWSKPQTVSLVRLDALPGGRHEVQVAAIDRNLEVDPTPAVATLWVHIDPAQQVAHYITDLAATNYELREAAVRGLAKQPVRALTALQHALAKANDDTRWWIDAAIQQCQENLREGK